uniref:E3 ubiquitin-protein ligase RBBP6-like n=1 Tax=Aquila chrysaetos chrysaetos TaxID=223781 RepID=A0A663F157_AQUCH
MSRVHYKFFSKLNYDTVTFDGLYISLHDLKLQIMGHEKLTAASCDLQITNAQTKEEYTDGNALIPKNSWVIVRRIPAGGVQVTSKTCVIYPNAMPTTGLLLSCMYSATLALFEHSCFPAFLKRCLSPTISRYY